MNLFYHDVKYLEIKMASEINYFCKKKIPNKLPLYSIFKKKIESQNRSHL